jgi:Na+/melibiose symporter-like transporter
MANRLFLVAIALTAVLVCFLPFVAWYLADHGRAIAAMTVVFGWIGLLTLLFIRGAT